MELGDRLCKSCGEPLYTQAEHVTGIHISCYYYPEKKSVSVREIRYGFAHQGSKKTRKGTPPIQG